MKGLIDSTLREGEQTPGVSFSLSQKKEIIRRLLAAGIEEIELGAAHRYQSDLVELMDHARQLAANRLALWSRCTAEDVQRAAQLDPDVLSLSMPVSDLLIQTKLGRERGWVLQTISECLELAARCGMGVLSLGLEDATRADRSFLLEMVRVAAAHGAQRIRLADTVGVASPGQLAELVQLVKSHYFIEVGVHTHNDFGMATANAVAAIEAGADWADVTVLGLGERAGCARLEEVSAYLSALVEGQRYRLAELPGLCATVARVVGLAVPPNHPVVGSKVFTCETGLHLAGLFIDSRSYEPFAPELVGAKRELLVGGKAGQRAVAWKLRNLGRTVSEDRLEGLAVSVRNLAGRLGRPLVDEELLALAGGR